ncbi:MAG: hypothetical protein RI993_832 [Pseudomonadota bacterium]|jgi:2-polyprenyl-3-methyl-5-hydroxy-6-metoxy-1,4-benzoquinol methylase
MNKRNRIKGEPVALSTTAVAGFFNDRVKKYDPEHPLTTVLYQDGNPKLAKERDAYEKDFMVPLLALTGQEKILDIGCGIGRWVDLLHDKSRCYCGIDFNEGLIKIARQRCNAKNINFYVVGAENVKCSAVQSHAPFDRVIITGLLIYLNDEQISSLLKGLSSLVADECLVYLREPIAMESRLTLNEYWSVELASNYSAIYRTKAELSALIHESLGDQLTDTLHFKPLYQDLVLNNRLETKQFYALLKLHGQ